MPYQDRVQTRLQSLCSKRISIVVYTQKVFQSMLLILSSSWLGGCPQVVERIQSQGVRNLVVNSTLSTFSCVICTGTHYVA